jgi:ankyrin repeat protein
MGVNRVNEVGRVTRRPPLSYAVQSGSELPLLQLLLERGAVVDLKDRRGFTAFDYACLNGRIDIVCLFLKDSTTDPAAPDAAASDAAAPSPTPDQLVGEVVASKSEPASASCRLLLAFTDSGVQASNNPLVLAATNNHLHLVLWLLQAGMSIDSQGDLGDTALHCAAKLGHLQTVQALLDYTSTSPVGERERGEGKVNVRAVNDLGNTPLHYAARNGHAAVVKLLIAHGAGADCLSPNKESSTPLSLAREFRRNEVLACMGFGAEAKETGKSTSRLCFCF